MRGSKTFLIFCVLLLAAAASAQNNCSAMGLGREASLNGFPLVMSHSANPTSRAIIGLARELEQTGRELAALSAH